MAATSSEATGGAQRWEEVLERWASPVFRVKHWQWAVFIVLAALISRLLLVLTHEPYLGIDGGPYLLSALDVLGKNTTTVGFPRPPLAPGWLLAPFIELLGLNAGFKVWTALFSLLPFVPVYLLTRDLVNKSAAIFALAFLAVDMTHMEMMITGSLPLAGFTCIGLALWCMIRLAQQWSRLHFWTLAGSVGILPYINQTSAGIAAYLLPLAFICMFVLVRRSPPPLPGFGAWTARGVPGPELADAVRRDTAGPYQANLVSYVLPAAFVGLLLALGSLPWYLANLPGNSELRYPGPLLFFVGWGNLRALLQIPIMVAVAVLAWRHTQDYRIRTFAILLGLMSVTLAFFSYDEAVVNLLFRNRYLAAILVYPCIAFMLCRDWPLLPSLKEEYWTVMPMTLIWLALFTWGQTFMFTNQTYYSDRIFPETKIALEIAKTERPGEAIITNGYSFSHWVAALNQVESPNTWNIPPSPHYVESDRHVRCLLGWVADCQPEASAKALGAGYVLIDERMPDDILAGPVYGAPSRDWWANLYEVPWLSLRYSEGTTRLWEIKF